jgi:hypothetical protein
MKYTLYYWRGQNLAANKVFIRIREEDKDDETLIVLNRLLATHGIDVAELINKYWKRYLAVPVPLWVLNKLDGFFELKELKMKDVLDPKGVR